MTRSNLLHLLRVMLAAVFGIATVASAYWLLHAPEAEGKSEYIELYLLCTMVIGAVTSVAIFLAGGVSSIYTWDFRVTDEVGQTIIAALLASLGVTVASWWVLTRVFELSIP